MLVIATALAPVVAVLVAILFGVLTLAQWKRTRFLSAAAELVHTMQASEFTRSIALIMDVPVDAPPDAVLKDKDRTHAFYVVSHMFESLGVLVYHRLLPLHLVDHLIGGYVRASWRRVHLAVAAERTEVGAMFGEWYQWLYDRLEQYPAPGKHDGAANAYKTWTP